MIFFTASQQLNALSHEKRQEFEDYFSRNLQLRLRPLFGDLSLFISIIGAILFVLMQAQTLGSWEKIHPLVYVYIFSLVVLAVAHRTTKLRLKSPLIVYLMFFTMAFFGYLEYWAKKGEVAPLLGLFFFLSSVGFITLSLFHSLILVMISLLLLVVVTLLIPDIITPYTHVAKLLSNWLMTSAIIVSPASALFNRWLFRNILALQFLLKNTNDELKQVLQTLKATEEQLIQQQKHQALSHMASGLLHEIINPVNSSIQAIQYAKGINKIKELDEALNDAYQQQNRVINIVEELKSFAKEKPDQEKKPANFNTLLKDALSLCRNELSNIKIVNKTAKNLTINCYPTAFTQLIVNLLQNSIKALSVKSNNNEPEIQIDSKVISNELTLSFQDNGIGITDDALQRIMDPFYTSSDTPERLGLGLSICQTIMRHHNGQLNIYSKSGHWTKVQLSLPCSADY
ncbi:sensor histidine kinase [Pleionea sediminis]|uniref:sensor histidine kinase n=1 Tax=Pleionea sediminis TaxID=2569479 RepID=UPI001186595F|nr:HAMP domain-containing sensor histidine kinase [Pleionea sediminis]